MFLNLEIKMFFRLIYIEWPFRRSHLPKELLTTKLLTVCLKIKMVGHSFFDHCLLVIMFNLCGACKSMLNELTLVRVRKVNDQ